MRFFINGDGTIPNHGFQYLYVFQGDEFGDVDLADWPNLQYCSLIWNEDEVNIFKDGIETGVFMEVFLPAEVTVSC